MTGHAQTTHRRIHPAHQAVVDRLEEKYAHLRLRFDTGFAGSVPVQASGRIGRRYFYFRFRGDTATLTIGSPDLRRTRGQEKRQRVKALRALRRLKSDDIMDRFWAELGLKPNVFSDRYPSVPVRWAAITDVTGERYAGSLEQDEAEALFSRLMTDLTPAKPTLDPRHAKAVWKGRRTVPTGPHRHVISKRPAR